MNTKRSLKDRYQAIRERRTFSSILQPTSVLDSLGITQFKCVTGKNFLTFLPQPDGGDFFLEAFVHNNIGSERSNYLCPSRMWGEECPICNYRLELEHSGEPREVTKVFWPGTRYLFFVLNMASPETIKKGVMLYEAPFAIMKGIIGLSENPRTSEILDISDKNEGFTMVFTRQGTGQNNTEYLGFQREDWQRKIPDVYYESVPSFEEVIVHPDPVEMEKALGISAANSKPVVRNETKTVGPNARVSRPVVEDGQFETIEDDGENESGEDQAPFATTEEEALDKARETAKTTVRTRRRAIPQDE